MNFLSQDGQDQFIVKLFRNKRNGVFVDIGAYDGIDFSNTFYLEKELNWKGICIEPNPFVFEKLKTNRKSICLNSGVGEKSGSYKFLAVTGTGTMLSGLIDMFDEKHLLRIDTEIKNNGGGKRLIDVAVKPLKIILEEHHYKFIDYCNIDVEGGEIGVLKSIDFSKVQIKVFTIENNYNSKEIRNFLKPYGYKLLAKLGADEVYHLNSMRYDLIIKFRIKRTKDYWNILKSRIKSKMGLPA